MPIKDPTVVKKKVVKKKVVKKKAATTPPPSETSQLADEIVKGFSKKHPSTSLVKGDSGIAVYSEIPVWFDTGEEAVNRVFGSPLGFPGGRIVELYSGESMGKSSLSYKLMSLCQEFGGLVSLADVEGSYDKVWAKKMGVNHDDVMFIQLEEEVTVKKSGKNKGEVEFNPEGMEDLFDKIATICREMKIQKAEDIAHLIVWDSVAATPTRAELAGEYGDQSYAIQARALSAGLKKLAGEMRGTGVILLCVNQTRAKIGGWRPMDDTPGGKALKFYATTRVRLSRIKKDQGGKFIECKMNNQKNKISPPFAEARFKIDYKKGLSWE
jgi:recombination protein RecA